VRRLGVSILFLTMALLLLAAVIPRRLEGLRYEGEMVVARAFSTIQTTQSRFHSAHACYATSLDELGLRGIAKKDGFGFTLERTDKGYFVTAKPSVFRKLSGTRTYFREEPPDINKDPLLEQDNFANRD
jgi:hypothetical protein